MTDAAKPVRDQTLTVLIWVAVVLVTPHVFLLALYLRYPTNVSNAAYGILGLAVALVALALLRRRRVARVIGPGLMVLAFLVAAGFTPLRRVNYMIFYDRIHANMTSAQVLRLFDQHFPDSEANGRPIKVVWEEGMQFRLDAGAGAFNAELIEITLTDGRVSDKHYLMD